MSVEMASMSPPLDGAEHERAPATHAAAGTTSPLQPRHLFTSTPASLGSETPASTLAVVPSPDEQPRIVRERAASVKVQLRTLVSRVGGDGEIGNRSDCDRDPDRDRDRDPDPDLDPDPDHDPDPRAYVAHGTFGPRTWQGELWARTFGPATKLGRPCAGTVGPSA
jgi:hypothetical protein